MDEQQQKDLVVLVADQDIEFAVRGLLSRHEALGFTKLVSQDYDVYRHPEKDPGCLLQCHDFLRPFFNLYAHALVMFDRSGCGKDGLSRERLENIVEKQLAINGWNDRAAVIVFDPELEVWVWSESPHVDAVLGWKGKQPNLTTWLLERGFKQEDEAKPNCPKEAVEEALRIAQKARSAALYKQLAERVSLRKCVDPAFDKLKTILQTWFPEE
jgi:hypothetical protein